jgi:tripartite-type tricarboxylate transporter receptor subunit TctC
MTRLLNAVAALSLTLAATTAATAQKWPDRPLKFISSQAAGNATDTMARLTADEISKRIGQPIVVENRPGGGNVIGTQAAARSAPDGYTFFFASAAPFVSDPYTFKSLPYDTRKDFVPVARVAQISFVILAHPDVPANNLPELFALAKKEPDKLIFATDGERRFSGMIVAWLNKLAGTSIRQVPYKAQTQSTQDVLAGRVHLIILGAPNARPLIDSGKLKPLAVTSLKRIEGMENVPTVAETFAGFDFPGWWLLAAPTGVPAEIINRMNREMDAVLKDPATLKRLKSMGFSTSGATTVEETRAYVDAQYQAWGKMVKEIGLQPM